MDNDKPVEFDVLKGHIRLKDAASDYNHAIGIIHDLEHFMDVIWDWKVTGDAKDLARWPLVIYDNGGPLNLIFNWMVLGKIFEKIPWDSFIAEIWDHRIVKSVYLTLYHSTPVVTNLEKFPVKDDDTRNVPMDCPNCNAKWGGELVLLEFHQDMGRGYYLCHKCGYKRPVSGTQKRGQTT